MGRSWVQSWAWRDRGSTRPWPSHSAGPAKGLDRPLHLARSCEQRETYGAWRNPKPTGGPYVCEQCRLDACGGNDRTLTMQAVTTIELAPPPIV